MVESRQEEHLAGVFPDEASPDPDDERYSEVISGLLGPAGDERPALARKNMLRHRWIEKAGRQERDSVRWGYKRMAALRVSTTDPDASPMHQKNKSTGRLGYLTHYAVDGGKARVVLNVGEAKEWHGARRFRLRGLEKVNTEALMIASGQNLLVDDGRDHPLA